MKNGLTLYLRVVFQISGVQRLHALHHAAHKGAALLLYEQSNKLGNQIPTQE